jgi:hypothetical protein
MKAPHVKPLDAAIVVLGAGLIVGLVARLIENSRPLASLLGL